MTVEEYKTQVEACEGLCAVPTPEQDDDEGLMRCVTCPFCKKTVDAILNATTISCPECGVSVTR